MRRREAREAALQIIYSVEGLPPEIRSQADSTRLVETFYLHFHDGQALDREYLKKLIQGVLAGFDSFTSLIQEQSDHWRIERMAFIDRVILRIALYELMSVDDIPASVTINEAVEISKHFSTEDSSAFINGILDQIRKSLPENPNKAAH